MADPAGAPLEPQDDGWYWSVDVPGLTRAGAERLVEVCDAEAIGPVGCIPGDPHQVLTLHLDQASVEALAAALVEADGPLASALLGTCRDWLAWRGTAP